MRRKKSTIELFIAKMQKLSAKLQKKHVKAVKKEKN